MNEHLHRELQVRGTWTDPEIDRVFTRLTHRVAGPLPPQERIHREVMVSGLDRQGEAVSVPVIVRRSWPKRLAQGILAVVAGIAVAAVLVALLYVVFVVGMVLLAWDAVKGARR